MPPPAKSAAAWRDADKRGGAPSTLSLWPPGEYSVHTEGEGRREQGFPDA